ncbi:MAG: hypothetical protein ACSHW7_09890 [Patiriisocius sp.]|uniref:hypothetical protein n=1 Tax=Patiriisocius sp. TaxID=2822396 RepID=UPI003EF740D2
MAILKNTFFIVRKLTGLAIVLHALYSVATITSHVDFVTNEFPEFFGNKDVLIIAATIFPFLEFLAGALLFMKIHVKTSAVIAGILSMVILLFIVISGVNFLPLMYHIIIVSALLYIFKAYRPSILDDRLLDFPKSKVDSWKYQFFRFW